MGLFDTSTEIPALDHSSAPPLAHPKSISNAVLDCLKEGILAADADGNLTLINRAVREFYGLEDVIIPADRWREYFVLNTPDYSRELENDEHPLSRALAGEQFGDLEALVVSNNQEAHYCVISGQPITDERGANLGGLIVLHDASDRRRTEQEVNRLASIVECSTDAVVGTNLDGVVVSWNAAAARLYEIEAPDAIGRVAAEVVRTGDTNLISDMIKAVVKGEAIEPIEVSFRKKDGSSVIVSQRYSPIQDAAGTIIGFSATATDISNRKRAEAALFESQRQLAEAQRVAQMGSWEFDVATGAVTWSRQMFRLFDFDPSLGTPNHIQILNRFHPDDARASEEAHQRAITNRLKYQLDVRLLLPDGTIRHCQIVGEPVFDENYTVVRILGTAMDITERKHAEQIAQEATTELEYQKKALEEANLLLESLATSDGLTGLRNRRALDTQLDYEYTRCSRYKANLSVILLDIDKFKTFNDTFGHQAGDDVIRKVADVLKNGTRESDIVARYGGEELCVVLPETSVAEAQRIAERLRASVETSKWDRRQVTVSLGVSTLLPNMRGMEDLILAADQALYASKEHGRNRVTVAVDPTDNLKAA